MRNAKAKGTITVSNKEYIVQYIYIREIINRVIFLRDVKSVDDEIFIMHICSLIRKY